MKTLAEKRRKQEHDMMGGLGWVLGLTAHVLSIYYLPDAV